MSLPAALAVLAFALLALRGPDHASAASKPEGPRVRVELLSEVGAVAPGQTFWVALYQRIAPGWHTYWANPGDSGEPPRIEWTLPSGFEAGEITWPFPEKIPVGQAMTYGYSREVVLPIPITPPARLSPGAPVTLRGQASWLACEKTCIPEEAPIALTLPVTSGVPPADPRGAPLIAAARQSVPTPSPWPASFVATREDVTLTLTVAGLTSKRITDVWFFPSRWGPIDLAAPQRARVDVEGIRLDVARGPLRDAVAAPIDGVLVVAERLDGGVARHAFAVTASPRSVDGLLDPTGVVGKAYGATNTPHMYIVDKAGLLVYAGAIDDRPTTRRADVQGAHNYVRAALEDMATGRAVQTPVTRAYGCTVKYA